MKDKELEEYRGKVMGQYKEDIEELNRLIAIGLQIPEKYTKISEEEVDELLEKIPNYLYTYADSILNLYSEYPISTDFITLSDNLKENWNDHIDLISTEEEERGGLKYLK